MWSKICPRNFQDNFLDKKVWIIKHSNFEKNSKKLPRSTKLSIQSFRTSIGQNLSLKRMLHEDRKAKRNRENYQSQLCSIVLLWKMQRREIKLDDLKECAEPQMRCRDELFSSANVMQYTAAAQLPIPLPVSSLNFPQSFYPLILRLFSFLHTIFARELS